MKKLFLLLLCSIFSIMNAVDIEPQRNFLLFQGDVIIQKPGSFVVTEDEKIIVIDSKAANVKFFDMTGKRISIFGRKGMGPQEFVRPLFSDYHAPYIAIADSGRKTFFVYKRKEGAGLQYISRFLCLDMVDDFCLADDNSVINVGYKMAPDKNEYNIYRYNFKTEKYDYITPRCTAYGFKSPKEAEKALDDELQYIGLIHFLDFAKGKIYYVWTCDLEVSKIDPDTKKITHFGHESAHFMKPMLTPEIKRAFHQMNHRLIYSLRRNMSYVRKIFVTDTDKVGVVYVGPYQENGDLPVMLQLYATDGRFIKEVELLKSRSPSHYEIYFYFRKSDSRFYALDTETSEELDLFYRIHEFQIKE